MSDIKPTKPLKVRALPLIIKKNSLTTCEKLNSHNYHLLLNCFKNKQQGLIKEDVIYKSSCDDFFKGKYPNLIIRNKLNLLKNSSQTVATYTVDGSNNIELTSDTIIELIGQSNYDIVFSALCSVISQESRVRGILALLTKKQANKNVSHIDAGVQTDQTCMSMLMRNKQRRKGHRRVQPYIVQDHMLPDNTPKKIVIDPSDIKVICPEELKVELQESHSKSIVTTDSYKVNDRSESDSGTELSNSAEQLLDLKHLTLDLLNEDSNTSDSSVGRFSMCSVNIPNILENPKSILVNIDQHTQVNSVVNPTTIKMMDGSTVTIQAKPEDHFHLATADILKTLRPEEKQRLLVHQALIDWKFCLQRDEDNNLPLHWAVLNNDADLARRQCLVLKSRGESVDIPGSGNMTALQMSLSQESASCAALLLQHGADPLLADEEQRTALHLAAEGRPEHVSALLDFCRKNAREILKDNEELWRDELESRTDEQLRYYLVDKMCVMWDRQGYTPLMLASKSANHATAKLLAQASPSSVNYAMPSCGDTALYLAVGNACLDAAARGNKSKVQPNFMKTIEILIEHGADPCIDNNSGSNVNSLLTEYCVSDISMLIANRLIDTKYLDASSRRKFDSFMLVKDASGKINLKEMKAKNKMTIHEKSKNSSEARMVVDVKMEENPSPDKKVDESVKKASDKPVILENVPVVTKFLSFTKNLKKKQPVIHTVTKNMFGKKGLVTTLVTKEKVVASAATKSDVAIKCVKIMPKVDAVSKSGKMKAVPRSVKRTAVVCEAGPSSKKTKS